MADQPIEIPVDADEVINEMAARLAMAEKDKVILTARLRSATRMIENQRAQVEELERLVTMAREGTETPATRRRAAKAAEKASG